MQDYDSPLIFLSYANPDQEKVIPFYDTLKSEGFNIWLDCRNIKPGQNWNFEIKRAFEKSSFVIIFLSNNSINRRGYVQRELKMALDKLSEKLIDDIYIIPIVLDDITIPEQLKALHCIRASDPQCISLVSDSLTYQMGKLGIETQKLQRKEELTWDFHYKKEAWDGLPGYEVELQFINFKSERYPNISEIGDFIRGDLLKSLYSFRRSKFEQDPDIFNYGQEKYRRTDTYDAHCGDPYVKGKVLTIQYTIHLYGAGAMHPNSYFQTYSFVIDPLVYISSLEDLFFDKENAFIKIQTYLRNQLKKIRISEANNEEVYSLDPEVIDSGTEEWNDISAFIFREEKIEFLFAPYQVAAYACGAQFSEIPYSLIIPFIKPEFLSALGIEYLKYQFDNL
jgi:TIR domain/Protein of unknown function (DUF3298)